MKRSVLVTGSSGGIGSVLVQHLAVAGYESLGLDINRPRVPPYPDEFCQLDLKNESEVERVCERLQSDHASFWGIVHCAGCYPITQITAYTLGLWDDVHAV